MLSGGSYHLLSTYTVIAQHVLRWTPDVTPRDHRPQTLDPGSDLAALSHPTIHLTSSSTHVCVHLGPPTRDKGLLSLHACMHVSMYVRMHP